MLIGRIILSPFNDYSGLNSLRKRLLENEENRGKGSNSLATDNDRNGSNKRRLKNDTATGYSMALHFNPADDDEKNSLYLALLKGDEECLGTPIYFFELNTATLVNSSQLVNLDEIARMANKYALRIEVVGAADSATSTEKINAGLDTHPPLSSQITCISKAFQPRGFPHSPLAA